MYSFSDIFYVSQLQNALSVSLIQCHIYFYTSK